MLPRLPVIAGLLPPNLPLRSLPALVVSRVVLLPVGAGRNTPDSLLLLVRSPGGVDSLLLRRLLGQLRRLLLHRHRRRGRQLLLWQRLLTSICLGIPVKSQRQPVRVSSPVKSLRLITFALGSL